MTADGHVSDVKAGAVDRDEAIDLALHRLVEERLHAAQVAKTLFTHVRDERDRAGCLDVGVVQRPNDGHQIPPDRGSCR